MKIPNHVAIIPDGNRRFAKEHNLPTFEGHRQGFERIIAMSEKARQMGIKILTIWAFSTENWQRSENEVKYLMKIYETMIDRYLKQALKNKMRIIHLGRKDRLNQKLKKKIIKAESDTGGFNRYYLNIALDYGGRDEIIRAIRKYQIYDEAALEQNLDTRDLPQSNVDLVIRTGGEQRTSGFLIWQAAYAEYIFVNKYLPDFTPEDFEKCIKKYSRRQRRFGK